MPLFEGHAIRVWKKVSHLRTVPPDMIELVSHIKQVVRVCVDL